MSGWVDLHCHWVPGIDDGVRDLSEALALLQGLRGLGFEEVVATPHLRPALFETRPAQVRVAFDETCRALSPHPHLPSLSLGAEHFLDPEVEDWILRGEGLPYSLAQGRKPLLLEVHDLSPFPLYLRRFLALSQAGYTVVLAHPERYPALWDRPDHARELTLAGVTCLLDLCSFAGKYGKRTADSAQLLLELEIYEAACSDAHRAADLVPLEQSLRTVEDRFGKDELTQLLSKGPRDLLGLPESSRGPVPR